MNLCKYCGVEVEDDAHCCPLCRNPLQAGTQGAQLEPMPPPVPRETKRRVRRWLLEIFSLLAATAAVAVFVADFASGMSLTWARFPLVSISFLWLAAVLLIFGSGRVWLCLFAEVIAVSLFLFVLDGLTQGATWFFSLALPLTLLVGTIVAVMLAIARTMNLSPFAIFATMMLAAALLLLGLELLLNRYLADRWFVSWSATVLACTLPLVLLLLYLRKRFKPKQAEIRKILNL